jgi:DNA-binding MarR family transcriptional regulator
MNEASPTPVAEPPVRLGMMGLDGFAPYLMNRIMRRYNADMRAEMAALGLSTTKMRVLSVLSVMDGLQMTDLGVHAVTEQSTLSRAVEAMVADGLVRREADPDDNRASRICLMPAGRAAFERLWPHMASSHERILQGITPDERRVLIGTLQKMLANIRRHDF